MALARTTTQLATTIVRTLGDDGGTLRRDVESELDNLIAWAKVSPRRIKFDTSAVGNVGAGLDVLHTFSLPAASLAIDGDELDVFYAGTFASNDTDKRVNGFFGGTAYTAPAVLDIDAGAWMLHARIIRLSSTSVRVLSQLAYAIVHIDSANAVNTFGAGFLLSTRNDDITGLSNLNSNATTMEVKGEGAANNDVVQNYSSIYLTQQ